MHKSYKICTISLPALNMTCSTLAGIPILKILFWILKLNLNGNIFLILITLLPLNKTNPIINVPIILAIAIAREAPMIPSDGIMPYPPN